MKEYLKWEEQVITDFSSEHVDTMYNRGFVFGRPSNGFMQQTRSIRIDLNKFELSSENRRILRKTEGLVMKLYPLPYTAYTWEIGKMGKDFYETKFGDGTFSANKIKELLTGDRNDFNRVLTYVILNKVKNPDAKTQNVERPSGSFAIAQDDVAAGYCIAVETDNIFHYSYPFYNLDADKNTGMGMMIRAVEYAKESGKQYIYLGSFQRPGDVYKLQFKAMEWFDGEEWQSDLKELKKTI